MRLPRGPRRAVCGRLLRGLLGAAGCGALLTLWLLWAARGTLPEPPAPLDLLERRAAPPEPWSPPAGCRATFAVGGTGNLNHNGLDFFRPVLTRHNWTEVSLVEAVREGAGLVLLPKLQPVPSASFGPRFSAFKGLVNHSPGDSFVFTKGEFASLVARYADLHSCRRWQLVPETYLLHEAEGCAAAARVALADSPEELRRPSWFLKVLAGSHGNGVELVSFETLARRSWGTAGNALEPLLRFPPRGDYRPPPPQDREVLAACRKLGQGLRGGLVLQRAVEPLLLLDGGRKFDLRVYVLVTFAPVLRVWYRPGYARLTLGAFNSTSTRSALQLTNTAVQSTAENFVPEDHLWPLDGRFREEIERRFGPAEFGRVFEVNMRRLLLEVFRAVRPALVRDDRSYLFMGADVIVTSDLRLYVLEVNTNPAMFSSAREAGSRRELFASVAEEVLGLALESRGAPSGTLSFRRAGKFDLLFAEGPPDWYYGSDPSDPSKEPPCLVSEDV